MFCVQSWLPTQVPLSGSSNRLLRSSSSVSLSSTFRSPQDHRSSGSMLWSTAPLPHDHRISGSLSRPPVASLTGLHSPGPLS